MCLFPGNYDGDKGLKEKTIMLMGATGSGKSTLVDGMVNYITGVRLEDPFRFTVVTLENEEMKTENQVHLNTITLKSKFIKSPFTNLFL